MDALSVIQQRGGRACAAFLSVDSLLDKVVGIISKSETHDQKNPTAAKNNREGKGGGGQAAEGEPQRMLVQVLTSFPNPTFQTL